MNKPFRMHPLHSESWHVEQMKARGVQGYHQMLAEGRMTGRSTSQALRYLSDAIDNPHKRIEVEDHINQTRGLGGRRIQRIDIELAVLVGSIANKLGLKHIHIDGPRVVFENRQPASPVLAPDFCSANSRTAQPSVPVKISLQRNPLTGCTCKGLVESCPKCIL